MYKWEQEAVIYWLVEWSLKFQYLPTITINGFYI